MGVLLRALPTKKDATDIMRPPWASELSLSGDPDLRENLVLQGLGFLSRAL